MPRIGVAIGALLLVLASTLPAAATGDRPAIASPARGGKGAPTVATTGFDLASVGYEQSEYFLTGSARSYRSTRPLSPDGKWSVVPDGLADYKTRIVVYRPIDPQRFDGTVMVEWLNVTGGLDAGANWTMGHVQEIREGMAWVGVSAQQVGVRALQQDDPDRYRSLRHPGDQFAYDIYAQAGAAARRATAPVLGGLSARHVIAVGESQSAFFLTSYVNALAPGAKVFDGFLIHSRAAFAAPLDGSSALRGGATARIRTDLRVPILVFTTETDLTTLGYFRARQPDSRRFRDWEVAGTSHYDAYGLGIAQQDTGDGSSDGPFFDALITSSPSASPGFDCAEPINAGPTTYVMRSAIRDLNRWVTTGTPPPHARRIQESDTEPGRIAVDTNGNARGGIRTAPVDVPVATLSGTGQSGAGFCILFGTTTPFDAKKLAALYPDHATFVEAWSAATDRAVRAGFILPEDATHIKAAAAQSTIGS
ncbi:MAG: alpha/beta hydrolase domain-containing protein [Acidimicrobiia bacterium]